MHGGSKEKRAGVIALGGNPNVGKSTVFNALTGLRQHTGNWPGKTVINAKGICEHKGLEYTVVDLPGCYSLVAHSQEEEVARDFLCSDAADVVIIVCDATCLLRNMNVVLQTLEITENVVVCVNLMDEARKRKIEPDLKLLSERLGVPVVGTSARSRAGIDALMDAVVNRIESDKRPEPVKVRYPDNIEKAIEALAPSVVGCESKGKNARWISLMLILGEEQATGFLRENEEVAHALKAVKGSFEEQGINRREIEDAVVTALVETAAEICDGAVKYGNKDYKWRDIKIDSVLTGKYTAFPIMLIALMVVFWFTIIGANYPSRILAGFLFNIEEKLLALLIWLGIPRFLYEMLVLGVYRTVAWVVSVMLPPMAVFFPLFTLLEDVGFLPRVAFNLDGYFRRCRSCGKQALTMCMEGLNLHNHMRQFILICSSVTTIDFIILLINIRFSCNESHLNT